MTFVFIGQTFELFFYLWLLKVQCSKWCVAHCPSNW